MVKEHKKKKKKRKKDNFLKENISWRGGNVVSTVIKPLCRKMKLLSLQVIKLKEKKGSQYVKKCTYS